MIVTVERASFEYIFITRRGGDLRIDWAIHYLLQKLVHIVSIFAFFVTLRCVLLLFTHFYQQGHQKAKVQCVEEL